MSLSVWLASTLRPRCREVRADACGKALCGKACLILLTDRIDLPRRQKPHGYREPDYPYKFVPEKF